MSKKDINQCSVVLTRNCNLRCDFCYVKEAGYCENENVEIENLKKIVDFCCNAKMKYIFFTGGEPILYPYLQDIIKYIKKKETKLLVAIASNGVLLDDCALCGQLINCGLDYIDVSIKGKNSQEWINYTGYDGYSRQLQAIENLSKLNIDYTCSMVVTMDNVGSICDIVKNAIKRGGKQFSFTFVIDNSNDSNNGISYLYNNNPFELVRSFISQIDELNRLTSDWWIEYSFPLCVYTDEQLSMLKGKLASPCQIHKNNAVTFDTQLNLLPCDMYFKNKIGKLGVDFNTVDEFLLLKEKNPYKSTIDRISDLPGSKCRTCEYLDRCFGGCPVLWKKYTLDELLSFKQMQLS